MEPVIERPALPHQLAALVQQLMVVFQQYGQAINRLLRGPRYPLTEEEQALGLTQHDVDDRYAVGYVQRYGDNIEPGVTDCTTQLRNWLNVGGQLYGHAQTFRITGGLTLSKNGTKIDGRGMAIVHDTSTIEDVIAGESLENIAIQSVEIDGKKALKTVTGVAAARGIRLRGCKNILIASNYIHDCVEHAISLGRDTGDPEVFDTLHARVIGNVLEANGNSTTGRGYGIWLFGQVKHAAVVGNVCVRNADGGIFVDDTSTSGTLNRESLHVAVVGNTVYTDDPDVSLIGIGIGYSGTRHIVINGNEVAGYRRGITASSVQSNTVTGYSAISGNYAQGVNSGISLIDTEFVSLSGNVVVATGTGANDTALEMYSNGGTELHNVIVNGNLLVSRKHGIRLDVNAASNGLSHDVDLTNNCVVYTGAASAEGNGVHIEAGGDVVVCGNTVKNFYDGVYFGDESPGRVLSNRVKNCANNGVRVGSDTFNLVARNTCEGNTASDIHVEASADHGSTYLKDNECFSSTPISGSTSLVATQNNIGF